MGKRPIRGMTLLEVLVALFIFAVAASAAVKLVGESARSTARLEARYFAELLAHNHLTGLQLADRTPPLGETTDGETLGGYEFRWTRRVQKTPDPGFVRIEVTVSLDRQPLQTLSLFREVSP